MKTIIKNNKYYRLKNEDAESEVRHHGARYVSKSEWKINHRDINKSEEKNKKDKKSKKQK